jgi:hypothetical protein
VYVKLFASIYQGTLRGNSHGLLVFTNLLAHSTAEGIADIHPRAIAEETGLTVDQVRAALDVLESPDYESRSPEEQGRRIVRTDEHRAWGWRIVNYVKYRNIKNEADRREQNRQAQARFRSKHASASGEQSKQRKPPSAQEEADAEEEAKEEESPAYAGAAREPTAAGALCKKLRAAGIARVAPGNLRFTALLDAGATEAEFMAHVPKALDKGNDAFAYLLGIVEGERKRAAANVGQIHQGALPNKQEALEQRGSAIVAAWAAKV